MWGETVKWTGVFKGDIWIVTTFTQYRFLKVELIWYHFETSYNAMWDVLEVERCNLSNEIEKAL